MSNFDDFIKEETQRNHDKLMLKLFGEIINVGNRIEVQKTEYKDKCIYYNFFEHSNNYYTKLLFSIFYPLYKAEKERQKVEIIKSTDIIMDKARFEKKRTF